MKARGTDAAGFSLVEIVIAMFVLLVIALALLPALIGATNASVVNRSVISATTFANAQLAPVRAAFPDDPVVPTSCAQLTTLEVTAEDDPAVPSTGLQATLDVEACPASGYPLPVTVTVTVYQTGKAASPIVTMPTKVLVSGP